MTVTKNLKAKYQEDVIPAMKEKFGYTNNHHVPKLVKIVLYGKLKEIDNLISISGCSTLPSKRLSIVCERGRHAICEAVLTTKYGHVVEW